MPDRLQIAQRYAEKGIYVFPIEENAKTPVPGMRWKERATTDEDQIKAWWGKHPEWNIGVAAEPSGLVIVDIDNKGDKEGSVEFDRIKGEEPSTETLTVETPSGGAHYYFIGDPAQSGTDKLAKGVDVKSAGGYVVGIGSEIDGKVYKPVGAVKEIAITPDWLRTKLKPRKPKDPDAGRVIGNLDQTAAIKAATDFLLREEEAIEGAGGDNHTFKVACRVLDFGLSMTTAHELMDKCWNQRCQPPWSHDALMAKIRNAWSYRSSPVGEDSIDAAFIGLEDQRRPLVTPIVWPGEGRLPKRQWLLGRSLIRGKVSQLIATGGIGKSTYALQAAMAVASGRSDLVGQKVHEQTGVLYINNEDEETEMFRRLYAARKIFDVSADELSKLHLFSGVDDPFIAVARNNKGKLVAKDYDYIRQEIMRGNIGLVIADPLVEIHEAEENDNREMNTVMRVFRRLAKDCNIAVQIIHHTNKAPVSSSASYAGNADGSRGASSIVNAARVVQTLYNMSEKEGSEYGIENHHEYVRLDDAKTNLAAKHKGATWFKKVEVDLDNGDEAIALRKEDLTPMVEREDDEVDP